MISYYIVLYYIILYYILCYIIFYLLKMINAVIHAIYSMFKSRQNFIIFNLAKLKDRIRINC